MKSKTRRHQQLLQRLIKRKDLPCVGWEMDWVYFSNDYRGGWRWGNLRRLWNIETNQERRAADNEKEQRKELGL